MCALLPSTPAQAASGETKIVSEFIAADDSWRDAKPAPEQGRPTPKTLAERQRAADEEMKSETPEDVERRRKLVERQQSQKRGAFGAFASQTTDFCLNAIEDKPGTWNHKTIDHWTWCHIGHSALVVKECNTNTGRCENIGATRFRTTILGIGHMGVSTDRRGVTFKVKLDQFEFDGNADRVKQADLQIKLDCTSFMDASPCTPDPNRLRRKQSIATWMANGFANWEFSSPNDRLTDDDKIALYDYRLQGSTSNQWGPDVTNFSDPAGVRCDSASYALIRPGTRGHACVFDKVVSVWTLKSTPEVKGMAEHIWLAQHYPEKTVPNSPNFPKSIPGSIDSQNPLSRLAGANDNREKAREKSANYRKSVANCKKYFGPNYATSDPSGKRECDEYPFQSTYQGAKQGGNGTHHFSVKAIPADENKMGGVALQAFYTEQHILDKDRFYVKILTADGVEMILPPPPPPGGPMPTMGDLNGDGNPDMIAVHKDGSGKLRFYPGAGDGSLGAMTEIGAAGWGDAAITHGGDFNGDKKQDVIARVGSELRFYPGNGDGTIGSPTVFKGYGTDWDKSISKITVVEDATGDGYPDVITSWGDKLWLYPGDPDNRPGLKKPIQIGGAGWDKYDLISVDDVDGDGYADLATRNREDGMMYLYSGPLNRELSQRIEITHPNTSDRATARLSDEVNMPLVTSGHDNNSDGLIDMWGTRYDGTLMLLREDPDLSDFRPNDTPLINSHRTAGSAGWQNIQAIG
ncbi:hypothetical protein CTZ27_33175 [Streptomyces griseocarneus]|nr:hypothetical protein CTZ27_33175 [Streptomyces griseocarneus]